MRLIDADVTEKIMSERYRELAKEYGHYDHYTTGYGDALSVIEDSPTIEAEPVVRCKECKHWKPSGSKAGNSFSDMEYIGGCEFTNYCRRESDFCSYGEKRRGKDGTT